MSSLFHHFLRVWLGVELFTDLLASKPLSSVPPLLQGWSGGVAPVKETCGTCSDSCLLPSHGLFPGLFPSLLNYDIYLLLRTFMASNYSNLFYNLFCPQIFFADECPPISVEEMIAPEKSPFYS